MSDTPKIKNAQIKSTMLRPIDIHCPHCDARPGVRCKGRQQFAPSSSHFKRLERARQINEQAQETTHHGN